MPRMKYILPLAYGLNLLLGQMCFMGIANAQNVSTTSSHCHQSQCTAVATASHSHGHSVHASSRFSYGGHTDDSCLKNCFYKQRSEPVGFLVPEQHDEEVAVFGSTLTIQALLALGADHDITRVTFPSLRGVRTVVLRQ